MFQTIARFIHLRKLTWSMSKTAAQMLGMGRSTDEVESFCDRSIQEIREALRPNQAALPTTGDLNFKEVKLDRSHEPHKAMTVITRVDIEWLVSKDLEITGSDSLASKLYEIIHERGIEGLLKDPEITPVVQLTAVQPTVGSITNRETEPPFAPSIFSAEESAFTAVDQWRDLP